MPNILSKFCAGQLGFQICHAECHELSHTWNPNCLLAIWDAMGPSFVFCGKTYGFLYLLKALIDKRGRVDKVDWTKWLAKTIRSSLFLTSTEILFMLWLCAFRRLLGFATWPTISFVNGFAACAISIWIESKQRRAMLIPYLLNLSSEALFRQAQHRGIVRRPLPFVESILFGLSIGLIVALLKGETAVSTSKNKKGNFASSAAFLGSLFHHSHGIILRQPECGFVTGDSNARDKKWKSFTITFKTAARNFLLSSSLLSIHRLVRRVFTAQRKPAQSIFGWNIFRLPLFLGSMPLLFQIFRSVSSLSFTEQCADAIGAVFSSSLAMAFFWPNNTLALYAFWKMIELVYYQLMVAQLIPAFPGGDVLLFCLLSAYLLSCAVLEPHVLRPSYYKFLCSLTGNRLQLFNRPLFSKFFSTNSSILLRRDFRPEKILSPKLLTINPAFYRPPPVAFIK